VISLTKALKWDRRKFDSGKPHVGRIVDASSGYPIAGATGVIESWQVAASEWNSGNLSCTPTLAWSGWL